MSTGDTTPISDEAVRAFTDRYRSHFTVALLIADDLVADALAAARPLLVSAETELLRESVAIHLRERERLEDGIRQLTESHRVEVEGLRAELAEAKALTEERTETIRAVARICRRSPNDDGGYAYDEVPAMVERELAALRAVGGQEKPNGGRADEDGVVFMPAGEAVETGTEWRVFAGGPDPDDCAMSRPADGEIEAEEEADWIIGGQVACRKVDYGPWQIVPPAAPVGGQEKPNDATNWHRWDCNRTNCSGCYDGPRP